MEKRVPVIFLFFSELQEPPVILMCIVNDNKSCFLLKLWRFSQHWQLVRFSSQKNCSCINYHSSCDPKTFKFTIVQPILFTLKFRAADRMQWRVSYSKSIGLMSQLSKAEFSSAASIRDLLRWLLRPETILNQNKTNQILNSPGILDWKCHLCAEDFQIIFYGGYDFYWNAWISLLLTEIGKLSHCHPISRHLHPLADKM